MNDESVPGLIKSKHSDLPLPFGSTLFRGEGGIFSSVGLTYNKPLINKINTVNSTRLEMKNQQPNDAWKEIKVQENFPSGELWRGQQIL